MEDLFPRLLNLTSHLRSQLVGIIEELLHACINGCSEYLGFTRPSRAYFSSASHFCSRSTCSEYCSSLTLNSQCEKALEEDTGERKSSRVQAKLFPVNTSLGIRTNNKLSFDCIHHQGFPGLLVFPSCCFGLIQQMIFSSHRCVISYARCIRFQVSSMISRVQKTLRGSADDIGWLGCTKGIPLANDGTPRFLDLLQDVRNGRHILPNSFVYLLIPGLFSNHCPLYFASTKRFLSKMGLACHIARIHSEASVDHNAWVLKHYIDELFWGSGKQVMLLGHSKGGVDAAAALSLYWNDLKGKVGGLALVQSPYGGTPIASDILREGQVADKEIRRIMELLICKVIKGDLRALEDLTYQRRREFVVKHKLPDDIPLISFHSEANIAPSVLATLTQIAHAELSWLPLSRFYPFGFRSNSIANRYVGTATFKVPVVVPISAAMAICALHLLLRYGEKSDGLVTCRDAEVPGSVVIRPDKKLDHAWMVYTSWRRKKRSQNVGGQSVDCSEMCEAILTMLVELGKKKEKCGGGNVGLFQ